MTEPNNEPFVVDKNMGVRLKLSEGDLPATNADGEAIIEPTQEEKYLFDTRGWHLWPGLLSSDDIEEMREYALRVQSDPESLPEHERSYVAGPLEKLADHPVVAGFLNEFLAHPHLSSESCYGFRMEGAGLRHRHADDPGHFAPHNGGGLFRFANDSHHYQCIPGKSFSGLTRVVWELTPVQKGRGGTLLGTGSHKAAYAAPSSAREDPNSAFWETYECPAGSLLIFTEALSHSTAEWTNTDNDRVALFDLYNSIGSRWSNWQPPEKLIEQMPAMRQTLFRGTHVGGNLPGYKYGGQNQEDRQPEG